MINNNLLDFMNKVIIFSAPSGAGKTTIVRSLLKRIPELEFSISATSRALRGKEQHGVDYYFLSVDEFKRKVKNGDFVEWEEVYCNNYYGTLKSEVERIWSKGNTIVFDVDVKGALNIKKNYGVTALAVFVMPPSIEELRKRLESRSTDSFESIECRIKKAEEEIKYAPQFDVVLLNDNLHDAINKAEQLVKEFIHK